MQIKYCDFYQIVNVRSNKWYNDGGRIVLNLGTAVVLYVIFELNFPKNFGIELSVHQMIW